MRLFLNWYSYIKVDVSPGSSKQFQIEHCESIFTAIKIIVGKALELVNPLLDLFVMATPS